MRARRWLRSTSPLLGVLLAAGVAGPAWAAGPVTGVVVRGAGGDDLIDLNLSNDGSQAVEYLRVELVAGATVTEARAAGIATA